MELLLWYSATERNLLIHSCLARASIARSLKMSPVVAFTENVCESSSLGQIKAPAKWTLPRGGPFCSLSLCNLIWKQNYCNTKIIFHSDFFSFRLKTILIETLQLFLTTEEHTDTSSREHNFITYKRLKKKKCFYSKKNFF